MIEVSKKVKYFPDYGMVQVNYSPNECIRIYLQDQRGQNDGSIVLSENPLITKAKGVTISDFPTKDVIREEYHQQFHNNIAFWPTHGMVSFKSKDTDIHVFYDKGNYPVHNHATDMHCTVLHGELWEYQWEEDGKTLINTRHVKQGESYVVSGPILHTIHLTPPVVTLYKIGKQSKYPVQYFYVEE